MMQVLKAPSFGLTGKTALIAGGSSGIGWASACVLAQAGAHVIVSSIDQKGVEDATSSLNQAGYQASGYEIDITDLEASQALIDEVGAVDILVNSAGLARHTPAFDTQVSDFDAVMDVNLRGAYFLTQSVAKAMVAANKPGSIVTISSIMGQMGGPDRAVYAATKHAIEGYTKVMAMEWGQHQVRKIY